MKAFMVRPPQTREQLDEELRQSAIAGVPGKICSTDCTHIEWHGCSANIKNQCSNGKYGGSTTLVFEISVGHNRKIFSVTPKTPSGDVSRPPKKSALKKVAAPPKGLIKQQQSFLFMMVRNEITEKAPAQKSALHSLAMTSFMRALTKLSEEKWAGVFPEIIDKNYLSATTMKCDKKLTGHQIWRRSGIVKAHILKNYLPLLREVLVKNQAGNWEPPSGMDWAWVIDRLRILIFNAKEVDLTMEGGDEDDGGDDDDDDGDGIQFRRSLISLIPVALARLLFEVHGFYGFCSLWQKKNAQKFCAEIGHFFAQNMLVHNFRHRFYELSSILHADCSILVIFFVLFFHMKKKMNDRLLRPNTRREGVLY